MGLSTEVADQKAEEILNQMQKQGFELDEIQDIAQAFQKKAAVKRSLS